jgi:hypothetical protein
MGDQGGVSRPIDLSSAFAEACQVFESQIAPTVQRQAAEIGMLRQETMIQGDAASMVPGGAVAGDTNASPPQPEPDPAILRMQQLCRQFSPGM